MFGTGNRAYINDPRATNHGATATIIDVNHDLDHPYRARIDGDEFAFWYAATMLSCEPISSSPTNPPQSRNTTEENPYDFDRTGLGIGGLGHHDEQGEIIELIASGELRIVERQRTGPMPLGQLWEPCPRCDEEPVCLICGYCERHCRC